MHLYLFDRFDRIPSCSFFLQTFLFATEVRHFCAQLQRGNVRSVEGLCSPPEGLIMCSPDWFSFASLVDPMALLQRSFVERCMGQALGGIVRKKKVQGRLVVRDDASITKFCDSFRYAENFPQLKVSVAVLSPHSFALFLPTFFLPFSFLPPPSLPPLNLPPHPLPLCPLPHLPSRLLNYAECAVKQLPISPWMEFTEKGQQQMEVFSVLKQGFQVGTTNYKSWLVGVVGGRGSVSICGSRGENVS